jgi:hypothetical protein
MLGSRLQYLYFYLFVFFDDQLFIIAKVLMANFLVSEYTSATQSF